MKKTLSIFVSVLALTTGIVAFTPQPVFAQDDTFRDVPTTHWAYDDVAFLKSRGLLRGYPGEVFIGQRPMTRYEFAAATRAAYENLLRRIEGLPGGPDGSIADRLRAAEEALRNTANRADVDALRTELATIRQSVERLDRLAQGFEQELATLGVDVQNLTTRVNQLRADVDELLKRPVPIDIQGGIFFGVRAGHSTDDMVGIDLNAGLIGASANGQRRPVGITRDLHVLHELGLDINGQFGENVAGSATIIFGNYLSYLGNAAGVGFPNGGGPNGLYAGAATDFVVGDRREEGPTDVAIYRAGVTFGIGALGGIEAQIGRIGYQVSPFTFKKIDPDYYFDVERYDDGNIIFDGARLGFGFGSNVKLDLFGGKHNNISATNTQNFQQIRAGNFRNSGNFFQGGQGRPAGLVQGSLLINTSLGANLKVALTNNVNAGATYIILDGPEAGLGGAVPAATNFNRVAVYGGYFNAKFGGGLGLDAELSKSQLYWNDNSRFNDDNWAANAALRWDTGGRFNASIGYREIQPFYAAPGRWGRIGFWYNPTDIKGVHGSLNYAFSDVFTVGIQGEYYTGTGNWTDAGGVLRGLSDDDNVTRGLVNLTYAISPVWKLSADLEGVLWDLEDRPGFNGGKPRERYITLGVGYQLGNDALLKLLYQISDYRNGFVTNWAAPGANTASGDARGGLFVTQLSVKF